MTAAAELDLDEVLTMTARQLAVELYEAQASIMRMAACNLAELVALRPVSGADVVEALHAAATELDRAARDVEEAPGGEAAR